MISDKLRYMLDTNICIYAMKGQTRVLGELLKHQPEEICISVITYAELRHGAEKSKYRTKSLEKMAKFLQNIEIMDFDEGAAEEYGRIKAALEWQGTPITPNDILIAAQANSLDLTLVTHNVREFTRVEGLEVADWS